MRELNGIGDIFCVVVTAPSAPCRSPWPWSFSCFPWVDDIQSSANRRKPRWSQIETTSPSSNFPESCLTPSPNTAPFRRPTCWGRTPRLVPTARRTGGENGRSCYGPRQLQPKHPPATSPDFGRAARAHHPARTTETPDRFCATRRQEPAITQGTTKKLIACGQPHFWAASTRWSGTNIHSKIVQRRRA